MELPSSGSRGALQLAFEVLREFGSVRLRVSGTSMLPAVLPGDVLTLARCAAHEVGEGELVAYAHDDRLVVHRLRRKGASQLLTHGDGLVRADAPVMPASVCAKVVGIERRQRHFAPRLRKGWMLHAGRQLFGRSRTAVRLFLRMHALAGGRPA